MAAPPPLRQILAKPSQLWRCSRKTVQEQRATASLAELPRSDLFTVERFMLPRGHRSRVYGSVPLRNPLDETVVPSREMTESSFRDALERVVRQQDLDRDTARRVMDGIMDGSATPAQIAALLIALRVKGETVDEITGMVESMRGHAVPVSLSLKAVDTCGTGGDGCGTFNISTGAALVVAGTGCHVAKHGNRAASSQCGSADVLEALGVAITLPPDGVLRCIEEAHIGFFFAPAYHPAMRHAAPVRKQLGVRTVFNLIGPLANPARVRHQTVGVGDVDAARKVASVLQRLGHAHAFVVCGPDGLDELGLSDDSICLEVTPSGVREYHVDLTALGLRRASVEQLRGGTADDNARIIRDVLAGEQGAARDVVVLNAAAALVAADEAANMCEGAQRAEYSIDSGAARDALDALIAVSNRVA